MRAFVAAVCIGIICIEHWLHGRKTIMEDSTYLEEPAERLSQFSFLVMLLDTS